MTVTTNTQAGGATPTTTPAPKPTDFSTIELNTLAAILAQEKTNGAVLASILATLASILTGVNAALKTGVQVK